MIKRCEIIADGRLIKEVITLTVDIKRLKEDMYDYLCKSLEEFRDNINLNDYVVR